VDSLAALARALRDAVVGAPLELPRALLDEYPELARARWRRGGLPPRLAGWALRRSTAAAITLWRTVFVAPGVRLSADLLLHELGHVQQFESGLAFPVRYLLESLRRGYGDNRYEHEAEAYARWRLLRRAGRLAAAPEPPGQSPGPDASLPESPPQDG
jgi:Domain of unknown function (DUF4157)